MTMKATTSFAIILVLGAAMLSSAAALPPQVSEDKDKIVLENDHVRVWFQGKKPMLKVFPADAPDEDNASGAYGYQFRELVEYNDLDGDGLPTNNEVVSSIDLNRASAWNVTREEGEDNVTLTLALTAPVKLGRKIELPTDNATGNVTDNATENLTVPGRDAPANITIVFHVYETATTIETPEGNVTVPETAIKYDLIVGSWPFINADLDRLALEIQVTGTLKVEGDNATVVSNDTQVGALSWLTTATGNTTEGETVDVPVRVGVASEDEGMSRLVFTYDAPDLASFVHDPTVGTSGPNGTLDQTGEENAEGNGASSVPGLGAIGVVLAVAVAVVVARRR